MKLRQTVPFIAQKGMDREDSILLLDNMEIPLEKICSTEFKQQLKSSLKLESKVFDWQRATSLVKQQYDACLEFIFSHPLWKSISHDKSRGGLLSYLLESRHYLASASFRMASGIGSSTATQELNQLLAEHVVEEANHNIFFERGLERLGCPSTLVQIARPLPATTEWITLMHIVASYDPLTAALCSGLLESSAAEHNAVKQWHTMLVDNCLLSANVVEAFFEHVKTDLELGHGSNWREAIKIENVITAQQLSRSLNAVTLVAEMIYRWQSALQNGISQDIVEVLPELEINSKIGSQSVENVSIWPAEIFDSVNHGGNISQAVRRVIAVAYSLEGNVKTKDKKNIEIIEQSRLLVDEIAISFRAIEPSSVKELEQTVQRWGCVIDGHMLWQDMQEKPTYGLIFGWLLENYHYISAIAQHTGAAIASCTDPLIRQHLVHHLKEELEHGKLLSKALNSSHYIYGVEDMRPLPTTAVFIGALRDLGYRNWRAYCVALAFLQLSLEVNESRQNRHWDFYEIVKTRCPESAPLLDAMRFHDYEDSSLGHGSDMLSLFETLTQRDHIHSHHLKEAALIAELSWSFLDGIRQHYLFNDAAVIQRIGWWFDYAS